MWDLTTLYQNDEAWKTDLEQFPALTEGVNALRDSVATSAAALADCLEKHAKALQLMEKTGNYAFLKKAEDEGNALALDRTGRYMMAATAYEAGTSWLIPAIQAIDTPTLTSWIHEEPRLEPLAIWIEKLLYLKPYILSEKEERILALQTEAAQTPRNAFSALTNVDLDFGKVRTQEGEVSLTQSSFSSLLENPDRSIRESAYRQFYQGFCAHQHTIASLYTGSVHQDVAEARIRGYPSARTMALFPDRVSETVYDNLIETVREYLPAVHRYYNIRKRALALSDLRHWDVYIPLVPAVQKKTSYESAVQLIGEALAPLGGEYTSTLTSGLLGGWVDRYENKGKRSGAFSSGGYTGYPYILMNYKEEVLRDVFTLAHEGGHSMHSLHSARSNPFMCYEYTIFEAEVASTFNEDLLFRSLIKKADEPSLKAYLLSTRVSDILATLFRQTMFAEFEKKTHALVESGTPLTSDTLRSEYRSLLEAYFGSEMQFEQESDLECLRIPHFYNAFYVYKYATGISAAMALANRVYNGGESERKDYFKFLASGGSRYPIDALKIAGVNMEEKEPVRAACETFVATLDELDTALQAINR